MESLDTIKQGLSDLYEQLKKDGVDWDFDMLSPTGHTLRSILLGEVNPEEVIEKMIRYGILF